MLHRVRILQSVLTGFLCACASMSAFGAASFTVSGSLSSSRVGHTITLLANGDVLVIGGEAPDARTAEVFRHTDGTFVPTGALVTGRFGHTATLLRSGKVLIVGGRTPAGPTGLATAEIYDPATAKFTLTAGNLTAGRAYHTATRLADGRVLIAGGRSGAASLDSVELYDPATNSFSSAGTMPVARDTHTATLLANGSVLVAGGKNGTTFLASASLYASGGGWVSTGSMATARGGHTATLLPGGNVLIAGGENDLSSALGSSELYLPGGTFAATASLSCARSRHSATLLPSGKVLIAGGVNPEAGLLDVRTAEVYDPAAASYSASAALASSREGHAAALLPSGDVVLVGGSTWIGEELAFSEIFSAGSSRVTATGSFATGPRYAHSATLLLDGRVLISGGYGFSDIFGYDVYPTAELYDPWTGTWTETGSLDTPRSHHTSTLLPSGRVLIVGGQDGFARVLADVEIFDPDSGTFTPMPSLSSPRIYHTATLLGRSGALAPDGMVLVAGGLNASRAPLTSTEVYDSRTNSWLPADPLLAPRVGATATLLPSGFVLITGGGTGYASSTFLNTAELFDPFTGAVLPTGRMLTGRQYHSATLLESGKVLIAGGLNGRPENRAELYDPPSGTFAPTGSMAIGRGQHKAVKLLSGKVLVSGGAEEFCCGAIETAEIYDPVTGTFSPTAPPIVGRFKSTATLLLSGEVLIAGGDSNEIPNYQDSAEIFSETGTVSARPSIAIPATITQATSFTISGAGFTGPNGNGPDASGGTTQGSSSNHPVIQVRRIDSEESFTIPLDGTAGFSSTSFRAGKAWTLAPGPALATVQVNGTTSVAEPVQVACGNPILEQPQSQTVALGARAHFAVKAVPGVIYEWYRGNSSDSIGDGPVYETPPVVGADSGTTYKVVVISPCGPTFSNTVTLTVTDANSPSVSVISPDGGEYWVLSSPDKPETRVVTWEAQDDIRVCRVEVSLQYSVNGGTSYMTAPAGGGLPANFGTGPGCTAAVTTQSVTYTVPLTPPAAAGALYRISVRAIDQVANATTDTSHKPFFIVQRNLESVKTIILWHRGRMGLTTADAEVLAGKLQELADHPRVQGTVVDLSTVSSLAPLYATWDGTRGTTNADKANAVLFGTGGIHEFFRTNLLPAYAGAMYVVLVGDDHVIPMARIDDGTTFLPESTYAGSVDLPATSTPISEALDANSYLSDDPFATREAVTPADLNGSLWIPDFAIGRLVETKQEIVTTIATYISQDGVLDLSLLPSNGNKVLITGYDFLANVAAQMRTRWKRALGDTSANTSTAPVDGRFIDDQWGRSTPAERADALRLKLAGNGGARFGIMAIAGHATHYAEGVPGSDETDIQGLATTQMYGPVTCSTAPPAPLQLAGGVMYAVGCHGGLPVRGSCATDASRSLDLPQTMMARGVLAYVANSGYGWSLKHGIGYSGRLVQIFTEEMTAGGTVVVGEAVRHAKERYALESTRHDVYDDKTLMQWTLFGLPMYAVLTGIPAGTGALPPRTNANAGDERIGQAKVRRSFGPSRRVGADSKVAADALPSYLTQLNLSFDLSAGGVYDKHDSTGAVLPAGAGCPDANGCYYTFNGLYDRGTGQGDIPIQPYLVYDSRLGGTSQHGVLWKGGTYEEESGWVPVIAQLISNGGASTDHGAAPRKLMTRPTAARVVRGAAGCEQVSDLELNSLTLTLGEAVKNNTADATFSIARRYRNIDLEVFYFNRRDDTATPRENCDRTPPALGAGPFGGAYHQLSIGPTSATVHWRVQPTDDRGDRVWRVVVVYNTNRVDAQSRGTWTPLELVDDGTGTFTASATVTGTSRVTYVIQAVDRRGNVAWLDFTTTDIPASGVGLGVPNPVDVSIPLTTVSLFPASATVPLTGTTSLSVVIGRAQSTSVPIALSSSQPSRATVPSSVTIAAGAVSATVLVTPLAVGAATITATLPQPLGGGKATAAITITEAPPTLTSVSPQSGPPAGGTAVTLAGTNFRAGATVTFGGVPATSVQVVSATTITATTPARPAGAVAVAVTNTDGQSAALASAFTYAEDLPGDSNGDGVADVLDVFHMINHFFAGGPAPVSGDANGDGVTGVPDIFYLINYLFAGGPPPR